ncbi:MAG: methylmalonyl Co-A mutase-associated GTPase MeaB [Planctomycetes bacterium]|nr:methylmalonyl Co-A mutase-associated GTPase MeaB [Planctomycetota bacterium]
MGTPGHDSDLLQPLLDGDRRALARSLTLVESRGPGFRNLLRGIAPRLGRAHRVGVTGAPGVGKSSLVAALVATARNNGMSIAVLAVDPTSPFTGGALLGDRVRMTDHVGDEGVFVRSMASRGALGGLSTATGDALDVLDAAGFDLILTETVGAGQVDVEVAHESETTLVLFAPGAGDAIQAMKSGLMEVADLWVVNKADDVRAEKVRADLVGSLSLHEPPDDLEERVVLTSAKDGSGVGDLLEKLCARRAELESSGARGDLARGRIRRRLTAAARDLVSERLLGSAADSLIDAVVTGERSVHDAAEDILRTDDGGRS